MSPETHSVEALLTVKNTVTGVEYTIPITIMCGLNQRESFTVASGEIVPESDGANGPSVTVGEVFYLQDGQLAGVKRLAELANEWHIKFTTCQQQSQSLGTENEHTIALIRFLIWSGDDMNQTQVRQFEAVINQPAGENFSFNTMPLEVIMPSELNTEVNYTDFRDRAEDYYRFALNNSGLNLGPNLRNAYFSNNNIIIPYFTKIPKSDSLINKAW